MNIIYIHTHDTGKIIRPYGCEVPTPNYQSFCDDAVLFQNAFSVAPTCSPSRAGLLTGVYPHQNGMLGLAQRGFDLDKNLHLANFLQHHGFHTALCGVQHEVGYYTDHRLAAETLGYHEDLSTDNSSYNEKDLVIWDERNAENLCQWLDDYTSETPFFVSYGMHSTHRAFPDEIAENIDPNHSKPPINLVDNEITREDFAQFQTSLEMADNNLGKIIDALKQNGLYENTIILVTTDHGVAYPFAKCTLNDSGIGVLMAMRVPSSNFTEKSYEGLISHIDVFPTLCDLLGIEKPAYLEGESFASVFAGEKYNGDDAVYGEINFHTSYEPVRAVRTERYKYIRFFDTDYLKQNLSNIDNSPIKEFYLQHGLDKLKKPKEGLYDLYYDVYEKNNLVDDPEYRDILDDMRQKLETFMEKTSDPLLDGPIEIRKEWKVNKKEALSAGSKDPDDYESLGR